jgi:opacity protein-like surface antigen
MTILKSKGNWMLLAGLLAAQAFAPVGVHAAEGGVSFGPRISNHNPRDADDGTWNGGVQLRIKPFAGLGFEGSVDYRKETFGPTRVDVYPIQASLLAYLLSAEPLDIFLIGGAGWYYTHVDRPSPLVDFTDHRFGLHAGGGVEFHLNNAWSVDGTYRHVWLEEFSSAGADLIDKEFNDSGRQMTVGLNYHF